MIKYNPKNWFKLIFGLHKSDTIRILWKEMSYIAIYTIVLAYLEIHYFGSQAQQLEKLITVFSLIGFVISLLLVFRTNTGYDRWWEGRKNWGSLVNDTRNLAIKSSTLIKDDFSRNAVRRHISNFVFATKEHLRGNKNLHELELLDNEKEKYAQLAHLPNAISQELFNIVNEEKKSGRISEIDFLAMTNNLNALLDSLGACERIKNTPIPYSYSLFIKKFIFLYVTTLPLAFISIFGYYTAIISTIVFYILVSMEILAEEIEDPFGVDANDLPTDQLCETIKKNVNEIFESN